MKRIGQCVNYPSGKTQEIHGAILQACTVASNGGYPGYVFELAWVRPRLRELLGKLLNTCFSRGRHDGKSGLGPIIDNQTRRKILSQ